MSERRGRHDVETMLASESKQVLVAGNKDFRLAGLREGEKLA